MKNLVFAMVALFILAVSTIPAEAARVRVRTAPVRRANVSVNVNRNGRNVQKVVVRNGNQVKVQKVVAVNNHGHVQNVRVERVIVHDKYGNQQIVERVVNH